MNWEQIKNKLSNHFTLNEIDEGVKVKVYFNLHKKLFSVTSGQGENYGRLLFHTDSITIDNVKFSVGQKGRQRVLEEKKKNVHAFCYGTLKEKNINDIVVHKAVTYNPYTADHFYNVTDNNKIETCQHLVMKVINQKGRLWTGIKNEKKK